MKKTLLLLIVLPGLIFPALAASEPALRDGDIIFQQSVSFQSKALEIATRSPFTHCGLIFHKDGKPYVFEAISTVTWTPLKSWIERGIGGHYVVMRLKNPLSDETLQPLRVAAQAFEGKDYDLMFNWSDDAIYCSELVWKAYDNALGIELTPLKTYRDYELNNDEVQRLVKERFKFDIPWDEKAVAPSDLMESPLLETVAEQ